MCNYGNLIHSFNACAEAGVLITNAKDVFSRICLFVCWIAGCSKILLGQGVNVNMQIHVSFEGWNHAIKCYLQWIGK